MSGNKSEKSTLFGDVDEDWCDASEVWWNVCWFVATAVILAPRAYIFYKEEGMPAAKQFALKGRLISFASLWFLFAVATVLFALWSCNLGDAVNAFGVLAVEYVAISLWYHYYGNGDLMERVVKETRERMSYLLIQGLGMMDTEREQFWKEAEEAIVNLWRRKLKQKQWGSFTLKERDDILFDTGVECGKVLEDQWEGVLYDVLAFFNEWRLEVETQHRIRMPEEVAQSMSLGNDASKQALLCVAIIVANEDQDLRKSRGSSLHHTDRQFCGARIARRKTAAEGILRWPDIMQVAPRVSMTKMEMDQRELIKVKDNKQLPFTRDMPHSVLYTLKEIIHAGYILIPPDGNVTLSVTFKHGNMVISKNQWNPMRTIERRPFRYINSATWMAGDVAFMVEQRELTGYASMNDGSGYLKGVLEISFEAWEVPEKGSWVDRSTTAAEGQVWGDIAAITDAKFVRFLNRPMISMLHVTWWFIDGAAHLAEIAESWNQKKTPTADTPRTSEASGVANLLPDIEAMNAAGDLYQQQSVALNTLFDRSPNSQTSSKTNRTQASTSGEHSNV